MVSVTSEVGRLRKVLVHEPGPEVDVMVPSMMEELLFDDILYGERAREEHGLFRRALQVLGVDGRRRAGSARGRLAGSGRAPRSRWPRCSSRDRRRSTTGSSTRRPRTSPRRSCPG